MNIGGFYQLICQCGCGSGLLSSWCKNEKGTDIRICNKCKPAVLHKIFEEKHTDLFENWLGSLFLEQVADGYEWIWADLLKKHGCEQVVGLEPAKQKQNEDQILIACPNGNDIYSKLEDNTVYILVPKSYAEVVLKNGKMSV